MNRKRLALSGLVIGALLAPTLTHTWSLWPLAYKDFWWGEEAEEAFVLERPVAKRCDALYPRDDQREQWRACYHVDYSNKELSVTSVLAGLYGGVLDILGWLIIVVCGGAIAATIGYFAPAAIRVTKSIVFRRIPAIISAYIRWLQEPETKG
jgi:hypothetical protein